MRQAVSGRAAGKFPMAVPVAGDGGLCGPRPGISSGILPGNSSGRGGSPGSRTGGGTSGRGLPGGASGGGSAGWPGVAGGISGGSIGIRVVTLRLLERQRCPSGDVPGSAGREPAYSAAWQTASMLWRSGPSTKAP